MERLLEVGYHSTIYTMKEMHCATNLSSIFGQNVKKLREGANLSQLGLALRSDITHTFINDLEHGNKSPSFKTIEKLSVALDVSPHIFFIDHKTYPVYIETLLQAVEDFKRHYG